LLQSAKELYESYLFLILVILTQNHSGLRASEVLLCWRLLHQNSCRIFNIYWIAHCWLMAKIMKKRAE